MSKGHRFFHRRAGTQVVTVNVEVVATVDGNGNLIGQETRAPITPKAEVEPTAAVLPAGIEPSATPEAQQPLPSVPAAPAVPSVPSVPTPVLPVVPSVPAFPSDLVVPSVPAFPFASGTPAGQVVTTSEPASPSSYPANLPESIAPPEATPTPSADPAQVSDPALNSFSNSTIPSSSTAFSASPSISLDDIVATILAVPEGSSSAISSAESSASSSAPSPATPFASPLASSSQSVSAPESFVSSGLPSSPESPTAPTSARGTTSASDATATSTSHRGGSSDGRSSSSSSEVTEAFGAPPAATTAALSGSDADGSPAALEMPQVVGSVVGSLAGAALILAVILLLLRRYKRKRSGALQLTGDDHTDNTPAVRQAPTSSSLVPAAFLPRFSGMSNKTAETNTSGGERSFQRVSGRKLPSAFSEGMTSDQFSRGGTISGSSFYTDDQGTYGGYAVSKEFAKETGDTSSTRESGPMNFRPSPARTPVIRHPDDDSANPFADKSHLSPPQSPKFDLSTRVSRGTLGRSLPSQDGSRSSRFTENV